MFDGMLFRVASHLLSPGQMEGAQQRPRVGLPEAQSAVSPGRQEEPPRKKQGGRQIRGVAQAEGLDLRGPGEGGGRKQADLQEAARRAGRGSNGAQGSHRARRQSKKVEQSDAWGYRKCKIRSLSKCDGRWLHRPHKLAP